MPPAQKKLSTIGGTVEVSGSARLRRRRSVKACCSCRERKVRCDVLKCGKPCTNCRLDDVECLVPEVDRRKRRDTSAAIASKETKGLSGTEKKISSPNNLGVDKQVNEVEMMEPTRKNPSLIPSANHDNPGERSLHSANLSGIPDGTPIDLTASQDVLIDTEDVFEPHLIYEPIDIDQAREESHSSPKDSVMPSLARTISHSPGSTRSCTTNRPQQAWHNYTFPDFIEPPSSAIPEEDVVYLSSRGALLIPPDKFRNALLWSYIEFVHPYLPLVDLKDLLSIIDQRDIEKGKISLLLFQSIMFAGAAFIDTTYLNQAGFATRKEARRLFFRRARLLYDFDCERDQISLVQSFLLLSFWFERPDDEKNTWHWLALAISLCQVIGLHRNSNRSTNLRQRRLWKRIWWSCFMRDREVALATRRPIRIKLEDCDVPMLTISDFEFVELSAVISPHENCRFLRDIDMQHQLAIMCIEKAKLCVIIGRVLSDHVSLMDGVHGSLDLTSKARTRMVRLAPNVDPEMRDLKRYENELRKWATELPDEVIYQLPATENFEKCLVLHKALLQMLYYSTTLCTLHWSLAPVSNAFRMIDDRGTGSRELSLEKARLAALEIIKIGQDLRELDLVRYLPTSGVTVVLLATIVLLGVKSEIEDIRKTSIRGFAEGFRVMQDLRDNYFSADHATTLLERAIQKPNPKMVVRSLNCVAPMDDMKEKHQSMNDPIIPPNAHDSIAFRDGEHPSIINYDMEGTTNRMPSSADFDPSLSNIFPGDLLNSGDLMFNFEAFDFTQLPLDMSTLAYVEGLGSLY